MSTVVFLRFGSDEEATRSSGLVPSRTRAEERRNLVDYSFPGAITQLTVVSDEPSMVELLTLLDDVRPQVVEIDPNIRSTTRWRGSTIAYLLLYCQEQGIPMIWWEIDEALNRPVVYRYQLQPTTGGQYVGTLRALGVQPKPTAEVQPAVGN